MPSAFVRRFFARPLMGGAMLAGLIGLPAHAAEPGTEAEGRNEAGFFTGGTVENGEYNLTFGAEYERRLTERLGVMTIAEHVDYYDAWVFLAPLTFRPWADRGLKVYAGPGVESREREREPVEFGAPAPASADDDRQTLLVLRTGVSWTFNTGGLLLTPQLEVDFGREESWEPAIVFGVSAGFEF